MNDRLTIIEAQLKVDKEVLVEIKNELKAQTQILGKIDVFNERLSTAEKRISALEANQSKLVWTVITIVLGALMTVVLKGNV